MTMLNKEFGPAFPAASLNDHQSLSRSRINLPLPLSSSFLVFLTQCCHINVDLSQPLVEIVYNGVFGQ